MVPWHDTERTIPLEIFFFFLVLSETNTYYQKVKTWQNHENWFSEPANFPKSGSIERTQYSIPYTLTLSHRPSQTKKLINNIRTYQKTKNVINQQHHWHWPTFGGNDVDEKRMKRTIKRLQVYLKPVTQKYFGIPGDVWIMLCDMCGGIRRLLSSPPR